MAFHSPYNKPELQVASTEFKTQSTERIRMHAIPGQ